MSTLLALDKQVQRALALARDIPGPRGGGVVTAVTPTAEAVCAHSWCRKPKSDQQHFSVADLPNPYLSHHPFKSQTPEADAAASLLKAAQKVRDAIAICTRCPWCAITADGPTDEHTDTCWVPGLVDAIEQVEAVTS